MGISEVVVKARVAAQLARKAALQMTAMFGTRHKADSHNSAIAAIQHPGGIGQQYVGKLPPDGQSCCTSHFRPIGKAQECAWGQHAVDVHHRNHGWAKLDEFQRGEDSGPFACRSGVLPSGKLPGAKRIGF